MDRSNSYDGGSRSGRDRSKQGGFGHREFSYSNRSTNRGGSVIRRSNKSCISSSAIDTNSCSNLPPIGYNMLCDMLKKEPDKMIIDINRDYFQLDKYLNDERMKINFEWVQMLTTLFERILDCLGQEKRIADILIKLPGTVYFDALYEEIRKTDTKTNTLRFDLILKTLKIINHLLTINPHAESTVARFTERIGTFLSRLDNENEVIKLKFLFIKFFFVVLLSKFKEIKLIKQLHSTVVQKAEYIYHQEQEKTQMKKSYIELRPPPDNFRLLNIIPSMNEILSHEPVYLRQNIVERGGSYENSDHYLDIHFRLLREDFLGPLRDGIQNYLSKSSIKNTDVRIYENVFSLGPKLSPRSGLVYGLQLDQRKYGKIQWANSRRLIYGSLLALTSDNFKSCTFVTIDERSNIQKDLIVYVRPYIESHDLFVNHDLTKLDILINCQSLTMVETTSYFEAYRHVLRALQKVPSQEFPLAPYILQLLHDVTPPNYVTSKTEFDFTPLLVPSNSRLSTFTQLSVNPNSSDLTHEQTIFHINYAEQNTVKKQYRRVTLLNSDEWPTSHELQLNQKQHEALMLALTKKVALIQGPPGTGKTFLGVKIAEFLLHNRSVWCPPGTCNAPILMVCQTNHALDQFLEHIITRLNMTDGLIRVGGRCKNEKILPFSLAKARQRYRANHFIPSSIYQQKRTIINQKTSLEIIMQSNETIIDATYSHLTSLELLHKTNILKRDHYNSLIGGSGYYRSLDLILNKWLGLNEKVLVMNSIDDEFERLSIDENEPILEEDNEEQNEEQCRRDEIDSDEEFFRPIKIAPKINFILTNNNDEDDEWQTEVNKNRQKQIIHRLLTTPTKLNDETIETIQNDLWSLKTFERYDLYRYWLYKYREIRYKSVSNAHLAFNQAIVEHSQYMQLEDYYILKHAIIVAMTTTSCKIVIVEEAAEIFEAHITTSLSPKCEHLILIGDHVQLRPSPSVYKLATNYNIDVSLFERFVTNNFPNVRLNIQHRMRPEICQLMLHFYDNLQNHESVLTERPAIIGVKQNLYFVNHSHPEEALVEGNSKQNKFEAEYIIALAHFLIKQGYEKSQITILVMYLGQRALISRMIKTSLYSKTLKDIRINVTDSFQGEENDIILLSLVRSNNQTNTIGFLKIHNRICVALSRARCAMYIVGNLNFLMKHEDMWRQIGTTLSKENAVATGLPLCCIQHPDDGNFIADTPASFSKRPEGGCEKLCGSRLSCGHSCPKFCHNYSHDRVQCSKICNESLPNCQHRCQNLCHFATPNDHRICQERVEKTIQSCNHTISMACGIEPTSDRCTYMVPVRFPCDHLVNVTCATRTLGSIDKVPCREPCQDILLCTHRCAGTCSDCKTGQLHLPCEEQCGRQLLCTHLCHAPCGRNCPSCSSKCETVCIHSKCPLNCGEPCSPCHEPCTNACQHTACSLLCSEPCDRKPCQHPCLKKIPKCDHPCIGMCGEPCPSQCRICNKPLVQELFFGNEDRPSSRFVNLPECNHLLSDLDRYMNDFLDKQRNGYESVRFPVCPRCQKPIRHCQRYIPIINQVQSWIEQIKMKQQNCLTKKQMIEQGNELLKKIKYSCDRIKLLEQKQFDTLIRRLDAKKESINIDEFNYMENTHEFFKEINRLLTDGHDKLNEEIFIQTIEPTFRHLIIYICKQCNDKNARNYAQQQLNDIQNELKRICCMINYYILNNRFGSSLKIFKTEYLIEMKMLTNKTGPFTKKDYQRFKDLVEKLKTEAFLSQSILIAEQTLSIIDIIQMETGHWFVCRNNHVYNIDHACQFTVDILRDLLYWSLSLKHVYLEADDRFVDISRFNLRQEQISSIENLTLRYISIDIEHLYSIVSCLRSLDTKIISYRHVENTYLYSFEHLQQLSIHVNRFDLLTLEQLLYPMTKLNQLIIIGDNMNNDVCDGLAWERILTNII
ncbi:unnamed protein product [Rotaria sp. Silwood2]|nr:unnamed protein product [Rotaria sp. Silwood2]CAF3936184.1 unnamed protein product [Rotaria sp. Silwood2]